MLAAERRLCLESSLEVLSLVPLDISWRFGSY